jgi:hypothetical protein
MKPYCLDKDELHRFIEVEIEGGEVYEDEIEFRYLLDNWRSWDTELICLATSLSQILEQKLKSDADALTILKSTYSLEESGPWLTIEGFDEGFVTYFLSYSRNSESTIENDLNYLRSRLGEHKYRRTI